MKVFDGHFPRRIQVSFSTFLVHVIYSYNYHGLSMDHGRMPILPGSVVHVTILDHVIHFIDCSICFEILLTGAVHLDTPQSFQRSAATLFLLHIQGVVIQSIDCSDYMKRLIGKLNEPE
jgi:hypothetical protein